MPVQLSIELTAALGMCIFLITWHVRNEMKILNIERELKEYKDLHTLVWQKFEMIQNTMSGVKESLARLEEKFKFINDN